jgi:pimeloyl-ACP methyl ester carboxylesterase
VSTVANTHYFQTSDGLIIYYRDFGAQNEGTPIICLPGLTRNSRDFEDLALRLSRRRRVLTIDFRGRGFSDHDPNWQNYHPGTYVADVWILLDALAIDKIIVIGTSLGGLCAMLMASEQGKRVAGVVLNDIGPEINPVGLSRIQEYTGRLGPVSSWAEAAEQTRDIYATWLPGLSTADWDRMARRAYREDEDGVPRLDIDLNIGRAVREVGPQKDDAWQLFESLATTPTTLLWGAMSDILSTEIVGRMSERKPDLEVVSVPNRGHAPLLDEAECTSAIDRIIEAIQ